MKRVRNINDTLLMFFTVVNVSFLSWNVKLAFSFYIPGTELYIFLFLLRTSVVGVSRYEHLMVIVTKTITYFGIIIVILKSCVEYL